MSTVKANRVQLGQSGTATQNFTLTAEAADGTMKLARGVAGATTQDILTINSLGEVDFPQLVRLYGTSGYQKLPGGLILQWGTAGSVGTGGVTVTFPIAFPNAVFIQSVTVSTPSGPVTQYANVVPTGSPKVSFIVALNTGTQAVGWFAIGY